MNEKPKSKDEVSKKLEESLAGLDLEVSKKQQKAKGKDPAKTEILSMPGQAESEAQENSGPVFTSEDLFTDIIASVERELQSEKINSDSPATEILTVPPVGATPLSTPPKPATAKTTQPEAAKSATSPTIQIPKPAAKPADAKKPSGFDSELERKLSSTLSGLKKPAASGAKPSAKPSVSASSATPEPTRRIEMPKAEPPAREPVVQRPPVKDAIPAAVAAKVIQEEGINFGQYLLLDKIATGGMAELFLAKRKGVEGFEKILAIKRILPHMSDNEEFVTMFIDEAKLAAQLTHHNICQIFDLGKIENAYYIAMEYVNGKDLRAILRSSRAKTKPMPIDLAVLVISKIASALDYAHRKRGSNGQPLNLVHRDVSPQNILISYEGEVKLVDFGIAKAATKAHVTQHGALKGKLLYMSPEQAWGKTVDKRSDIFSLGIVLYELLTGRPLFFDENDTEVTILEKVREAKITPTREFNSRV
ncbi:MAG: protein kinase domain-containing protein, partial [Acidobacteriota bacterium]